MPLTDQIKNSTAVQALVGAGDFVVERIRTGARSIDVENASARAQTAAQERVDQLVAELRDLPEQLRALPDKAQAAAAETLSIALSQALTTYGDLAERGEHLVTRIRNQQATKDTVAQAKTTKSQAKGTATTAKKSAKKTASTTKRSAAQTRKKPGTTGRTAKKSATKSASATRTRAKATGTSAKKTASAAKKATSDAAKKVGN